LTVYKYEDVVYEKRKLLSSVITILGLKRNRGLVTAIAKQFDIVPEAENEYEHTRQVHPGNSPRKPFRY